MTTPTQLVSFWVKFYAILTHNVSQIFHFTSSKGTFGLFEEKVFVLQQMKEFVHMKNVVIPSANVDEDLFKENQEKLSKVRFQCFFHANLEGGWGIAKAKRNDQ
jgi:hypothetical protein